jgi:hypothetical protein
MALKPKSKRIGRPPRTDDPRTLTIILPGELKKWLRVHAAVTERDMGDIVAEALERLRKGKAS